MTNHIMRNLELYYPFLVEDADEIFQASHDELVIKLKDGKTFLYDDCNQICRKLPDNKKMTEEEFKIEFGYKLRKLMYKKNITQVELSERTEIPRVMISNYIRGRNIPSFYKIDKIAKALDCSTDEFRYIY